MINQMWNAIRRFFYRHFPLILMGAFITIFVGLMGLVAYIDHQNVKEALKDAKVHKLRDITVIEHSDRTEIEVGDQTFIVQ